MQVPPPANAGIRIQPAGSPQAVQAAAQLFDNEPNPQATERFLTSPDHHLLLAFDSAAAEGAARAPIGMISGVETTHPDKGTELFLYELAVAENARGRGVATELINALADLGRQRGCYAMWVVTEQDNAAANAAYLRAGAQDEEQVVMYSWDLSERQEP